MQRAPIRGRARQQWNDGDHIARARLVNSLPIEGLAALIETKMIDDAPAAIAEIGRERYMVARHIEKTGLAANYPLSPSAAEPLAMGVDQKALEEFVRDALKRMKDRHDDVDAVADVLRNTVVAIGIATDLHPDNAFSLLITGKLAA